MAVKDEFTSCFAPYIEDMIIQKQREGFIYESTSYHLKCFDTFCEKINVKEPCITKELMAKWGTLRDTEGKIYLSSRMSAVRQLCLYMQSLGMDSYIPAHFSHKSHMVAHVMDDMEIKSFFEQADSYHPILNATVFIRLSMEYRVLFRMIFCCGLRISEARKLTLETVDLEKGTLSIYQSKGHKDRIVYIPEDLSDLCKEYLVVMQDIYGLTPEWFFPARDPNKKLSVCTIDKKFREFWAKTPYSSGCDHNPTVHSLRHSFVVKRMNLWMENDIDLNAMMPYLSNYLGHSSVDDTFYYYHQIDSAFKIIKKKDISSAIIIPEVDHDEE
jgi:integrase/recombinase XerD